MGLTKDDTDLLFGWWNWSRFFRHLEFSFVVVDMVYMEGVIGKSLRMWIVRITSCLLLSMALCLTGHGLKFSHI